MEVVRDWHEKLEYLSKMSLFSEKLNLSLGKIWVFVQNFCACGLDESV